MVSSDIEADESLVRLPPPATLRALEEQNTHELRVKLLRFAESRVRLVREAGQPVSSDYAIELLDDAITNTWLGISRWNPERCPLLVHLRCVILDRTGKEMRRGRRFVHVPIHVAANDSADDVEVEVEHELEGFGNSVTSEFIGFVFRVASELKMIAHGDANAHALLDCWCSGIIECNDVIARTGLTEIKYRTSRRRLFLLAKQLPVDLRESACELLRSVS
jgi:hypothetical protein